MSAEMSFNETLNLKNVSANYNETESNIMNNKKELTHTEAEIEKALVERNKLQAELDRLTKKETQDKHKLDTLKNRYKEEKRRCRYRITPYFFPSSTPFICHWQRSASQQIMLTMRPSMRTGLGEISRRKNISSTATAIKFMINANAPISAAPFRLPIGTVGKRLRSGELSGQNF